MPHESPIESPPQQQEATEQATSQKTTSQQEPPLELVDSHAHLDVSDFDSDREAMLARAQAAGVETILAIGGGGADPAALGSSLPFAEQHSWIYAAAGIHPHEARLATPAHYDTLSRIAAHPRFLGWGEIGLDYHYDHSPRDVQQRVFADQLHLARASRCPVILHCRDAWPDCLAALEAHWRSSGLGGIFHCFTGTIEEARRGIDMGFLISFAGNVTFPKAQSLRDVAAARPVPPALEIFVQPNVRAGGHTAVGSKRTPSLGGSDRTGDRKRDFRSRAR